MEINGVVDVIDKIVESDSMNEWQRQWVIQTIHELEFLHPGSGGELTARRAWVVRRRLDSPSPVTAAYATLALAAANVITFDEVMHGFESAPAALLSWYAEALRLAANGDGQSLTRLNAAAKATPIHSALLAVNSAS